ncbi:hypothetical protein DFH09DRAFT_1177327, partial [Mycena vulgaris]
QGVAAALSSSHLHRPSARARGAGFVPDSPPASPRARAGVVRGLARCTGMTRAASARCPVKAAQRSRPRPRAFPLGLRHPRLGRRRRGERAQASSRFGGWRTMWAQHGVWKRGLASFRMKGAANDSEMCTERGWNGRETGVEWNRRRCVWAKKRAKADVGQRREGSVRT